MSEIIIDSLSKYIEEIERYPSTEYLFRGESQKYRERTASALREYTGNFQESNKVYPFNKMLDSFYREVTSSMSNLEHKNFIAFAQHHGIPTTLIDVTRSPLVALYFACQNNDEKGYVYTFKDNYIDITQIIQKYPNKNVIEELFLNSDRDYLILLPLLENYHKVHLNDFIKNLEILFDEFTYFFSSNFTGEHKQLLEGLSKVKPYLKELSDDRLPLDKSLKGIVNLHNILNCLKELDPTLSLDSLNNYPVEIIIYLNLIKMFFKNAYKYGEPIWWINFLPNLVYEPIMRFDRGLSQSGLFFYQSYASYIEPAYDFRVQMVQRIQFNKPVFIINNKIEIIKSLDNIGINRMTIFKDFDNTASYIKNKYEML